MLADPNADALPTNARHPIALVAERTGLSQDTLRMWERRYGAVQPTRSAGGQRFYSDADLERLRLLVATLAAGRRIGGVARLATEELRQLVEEDRAAQRSLTTLGPATSEPDADFIERVLAHVRALDPVGLENLLRREVAARGLAAFSDHVAAPVLRRIGDDWHDGRLTIAQEHLGTAVIGDIIAESMRTLSSDSGAPRVLVATLSGNRHVIGAALVGAAAAAEGWSVAYLGADVPASEIATAAVASGARAVAISVTYSADVTRTLRELRGLADSLAPGVELVVGGAALIPHARELAQAGIELGEDLDAFRRMLRRASG